MQLILDSEPALATKRDMSAMDEIHTEKVGNGDIQQVSETNCNGNKENIGDVNVITNDDKNKQIADIDALPNLPIDNKLDNTEAKSSVETAIEEETCEINTPLTNGALTEESNNNGLNEEIQIIKKESEEKSEEVEKESRLEDEKDIIHIKQENCNDILDITVNEPGIVIPENEETKTEVALSVTKDDETKTEEALSVTKDDETETEMSLSVTKDDETETEVALSVTKDDETKTEEALSVTKDDETKTEEALSVTKDDKTKTEEALSVTKDDKTKTEEALSVIDVDVIKEPSKTITIDETLPDIELKEPIHDVELEEPESTIDDKDKHVESSENKDKQPDEIKSEVETPECDSTEVISSKDSSDPPPIELKDDMDVEEVVDATKSNEQDTDVQAKGKSPVPVSNIIDKPILCKLSNTLDILSDDEEEPLKEEPPKVIDSNEKQCINIEDDDDIMLIDEDTNKTEIPQPVHIDKKEETPINADDKNDSEASENKVEETIDLFAKTDEKDSTHAEEIKDNSSKIVISEKEEHKESTNFPPELPLLPDDFLKSAKKNLADMTREDLEEFCILKIVESIVDRSNISEIKNKLKSVAQGIDEYRKKTMMLTKQNRDLQVVLKSIQEEQKKITPGVPITPLKITRSVGMQVFMEKTGARRKSLAQLQNSNNNTRQSAKSLPATNPRPQKPAATQPIPVPRLVPANNPAIKSPNTIPTVNQITPSKTTTPTPNGIKNLSPSQKAAEKRQHNRIMSVTVDLTDDEPPTKINNRTSPAPPVRVVPSQTLMATPRQAFPAPGSNPRKVYIPISNQQGIRPGQTIMLKNVPTQGLRPRCPTPQVGRLPTGPVRMNRAPAGRHPAPLPESMKQYQPPNWKALPPAPDLKLSKVENGIVISWKIEGYQEDSYEEIASYQLYAYQETSSPPSTSLWKKIGDVKALPLPMACTLTQFMAGFKYFFAVRAVDIRSRLGPFSLPGSILLLNKL